MRTKVLLSAVAMAAACAFTARAQNVYSLNVVGYINIPLMDNWSLVANQLDLDGTGVNNTINTVLGSTFSVNGASASANLVGTVVNGWDPVNQVFLPSVYSKQKGGGTVWNPVISLNPGAAFFIEIPAGTFGAGNTGSVTTVGQVLQGNLANAYLSASGNWSMLGNIVPIAGGLTSVLNYQPTLGDTAELYDPSLQQFVPFVYSKLKNGTLTWTPSEPQIAIGSGFFLQAFAATPAWSTNFTVQ